MEFNLFLPQMRLSFDDLVARARAAEAAGFVGITGMDHLVPPLADDQPMFEAIVTTTWLAAHTERLRIGSLVLCDAFRHPRCSRVRRCRSTTPPAVATSSASDGVRYARSSRRSVSVRSSRACASIASARRWRSCARCGPARSSTTTASYHQLHGARQEPRPLGGRIPILIGGIGPKTLALVREFADWWNVHVGQINQIEELRPQVGDARVSIQQTVALIGRDRDREAVTALATRRFGWSRPVIGTASELVDYYGTLAERGVERVYTWFCDFAPPDTLAEFGEDVIAPLRG